MGKFSRGRPLDSKGREPEPNLHTQGLPELPGHKHGKIQPQRLESTGWEVGVKRQEMELNIRQKRNKILTNV